MDKKDYSSFNHNNLKITNWIVEDRPREKLEAKGAEVLSNAELLAILIGSGSTKETAVALMQRIVVDCKGSLRNLGKMSIEDLCQYKGIGKAKAITILAACELGKRRASEDPEKKPHFNSPEKIYSFFAPKLEDLSREEFHILLLNQRLKLIKSECLSKGGITSATADIRILCKSALLANATSVAICHNHPGGDPNPSKDDDYITDQIKKSLNLLDIKLIDHIIIGDKTYYSYANHGKLIC